MGQSNLVRVYRAAAEECAAAGDGAGSIGFLERCLAVAKAGMDPASEGLANHRLGLAHAAAGSFERAIAFQAGGLLRTGAQPTLCEPSPRVCMSIRPEGKSCSNVGSSACSQ